MIEPYLQQLNFCGPSKNKNSTKKFPKSHMMDECFAYLDYFVFTEFSASNSVTPKHFKCGWEILPVFATHCSVYHWLDPLLFSFGIYQVCLLWMLTTFKMTSSLLNLLQILVSYLKVIVFPCWYCIFRRATQISLSGTKKRHRNFDYHVTLWAGVKFILF